MANPLYQQHLLSLKSLDQQAIDQVISTALTIKAKQAEISALAPLKNKVIASCFYEPSTRTRLSFEAAALKLGANIIGFSEGQNTSQAKGESLSDSLTVINGYADLTVLRHPEVSAVDVAAQQSTPVINAGNGAGEHPSQALLDLVSIFERQQTLSGLHIALMGDLKYGRTVHSLISALTLYKPACLYLIAPEGFQLPDTILKTLNAQQINYRIVDDLDAVLENLDLLYMTRLQTERLQHQGQSQQYNQAFCLNQARLSAQTIKPNLQILHPLPRGNELASDVDSLPCAGYFTQAQNGLYTRQAILALTLLEHFRL